MEWVIESEDERMRRSKEKEKVRKREKRKMRMKGKIEDWKKNEEEGEELLIVEGD